MLSLTTGNVLGLQFDQERVRVMNRTGTTLVVGDVVMFDLLDSETNDNFTIGDAESVYATVVVPAAAGLRNGFFGIVTTGGVDNAEVVVCIRGLVTARIDGAATNGAALIAADTADTLTDTAGALGQKIIGILGAATAGAASELVVFNGIEGFGAADDQ